MKYNLSLLMLLLISFSISAQEASRSDILEGIWVPAANYNSTAPEESEVMERYEFSKNYGGQYRYVDEGINEQYQGDWSFKNDTLALTKHGHEPVDEQTGLISHGFSVFDCSHKILHFSEKTLTLLDKDGEKFTLKKASNKVPARFSQPSFSITEHLGNTDNSQVLSIDEIFYKIQIKGKIKTVKLTPDEYWKQLLVLNETIEWPRFPKNDKWDKNSVYYYCLGYYHNGYRGICYTIDEEPADFLAIELHLKKLLYPK